jgi:hypothetical protein
LVIFCVFRIESIRLTMSLNAGTYLFFCGAGSDAPTGSGVSW